uniref:Epidermal growth factor n=1 Tax=Parastrongyloides trichosuri TaxID=131310 RepID=A0A0N5A1S3_PARTI
MHVDPERIAARLRIEEEILNDKIEKVTGIRNRRQLGGGNPTEINIQVTAPLFSSRLFEYGIDAGDDELPQQLDSHKKLSLRYPVKFYGEKYTTINVLANGAIGFDENSKGYKLNVLPGNMKLIAPFWNRNNLLSGGAVYFREITSGRVLERGQSEIRYQYDKSVHVKSAIVVTWDRMQPIKDGVLPEENTNTFQMVIFNCDNESYANFVYSNIGWTQGAEAGFSKGNNVDFFALPTSGTGNIMYLEEYGNTGIPGEWMFELDDKRIIRCKLGIKGDTCDEQCPPGEWGPDCHNCCHCETGSCNTLTGECAVGVCSSCYTGPSCSIRKENCGLINGNTTCAPNAVAFNDVDRCGEPIQKCQCLSGYEGDGVHVCTDINECNKPDICHENAICTNTPGKYFCQCKEGYIGDGVNTCESSILYKDTTGGKAELQKSKNSKVSWQLRYPLMIFGLRKKDVVVSSSGLLSILKNVGEANSLRFPDGIHHLEDMDIQTIAPFYSPIDLSRGGKVTISETSDNEMLQRATRTVSDNLPSNEGFMATSLFIVTYNDVVTSFNPSIKNTFQVALIGGRSRDGSDVTYAHMIYKDINWSDGAEAGIMPSDRDSFVVLPGSGIDGLGQLASTSNIKLPGEWLFKIDSQQVSGCLKKNLQPPFCDRPLIQDRIVPLKVSEPNTIKSTSRTPLKTTLMIDENETTEDDLDEDSMVVTFPPSLTLIPEIMGATKKPALSTKKIPETIEIINPVQSIIPEINFSSPKQPLPKTQRPTTSTTAKTAITVISTTLSKEEEPSTTVSSIIRVKPTESLFANDDGNRVTESRPIYVFSTARPLPTKPVNTNNIRSTTSPTVSKVSSHSKGSSFDITRNTESSVHSSNMFILIVSAVIALWLLFVIALGIFICCKKRKNQAHFATIYGPAYQVHAIPNTLTAPYGMMRKPSSSCFDDYEDGVDKQVRLSNEFSSYNQTTGRISLYGSYWNLPTPLAGAHVGPAAFGNPSLQFNEALHHNNNLVIPSNANYNYTLKQHTAAINLRKNNIEGLRKLGTPNIIKNTPISSRNSGGSTTNSTASDSIPSTPPLLNNVHNTKRISQKTFDSSSTKSKKSKVLLPIKDTHQEQMESIAQDIKKYHRQTSPQQSTYYRENLI